LNVRGIFAKMARFKGISEVFLKINLLIMLRNQNRALLVTKKLGWQSQSA
jgi:hypothetical protein